MYPAESKNINFGVSVGVKISEERRADFLAWLVRRMAEAWQ